MVSFLPKRHCPEAVLGIAFDGRTPRLRRDTGNTLQPLKLDVRRCTRALVWCHGTVYSVMPLSRRSRGVLPSNGIQNRFSSMSSGNLEIQRLKCDDAMSSLSTRQRHHTRAVESRSSAMTLPRCMRFSVQFDGRVFLFGSVVHFSWSASHSELLAAVGDDEFSQWADIVR